MQISFGVYKQFGVGVSQDHQKQVLGELGSGAKQRDA